MVVERLKGGPWGQNAFLVSNGNRALMIDPGGSHGETLALLTQRQLDLVAILNTHGHFDHLGAVQPLVDATGARFHISAQEVPIMKSANLLRFIFKSKEKVQVPTTFTDLDGLPSDIEIAGLPVHCLRTPGHTPGGYCFLIEDHLFSGDTLLREIPGSSSLPGGDAEALSRSLAQLAELPPQTTLHPGHGRDTTLGEALDALRARDAAPGDAA